MYPHLLHIYGPLYVNTYGAFIACAVLVFSYFAQRAVIQRKLMSESLFATLVSLGIVTGVIGGRVLYIMSQPDQFSSWEEWFLLWHGGLSVLGAISAVFIQSALIMRLNNVSMLLVFDTVAPYVALMQSIARIGCFFAGCCYGTVTTVPWAIIYTQQISTAPVCQPLHPTQLYSAIILFLIFIALRYALRSKLTIPGQMTAAYLMMMSVERFSMDFVRADLVYGSWWPATVLSVHQLIALGIFVSAAIFYGYQTMRYKHT
jgi:phosphatidylglycerol:prolipoprotein diacylglycerol transferase